MTEPAEFTGNSPVAPCRVVLGHPNDKIADFERGRLSSTTSAVWSGPTSCDKPPVPSEQSVGRDDPPISP